MKARFLAIIAIAVAAACYGYSKFTQPKIVAWGDSLTFGVGAKDFHGYPDYLKDDGYEVVKKGYPGQASSDIALRQGGLSPVIFTAEKSPGVYSVIKMEPSGDFKKHVDMTFDGLLDDKQVKLKRLASGAWEVESLSKINCDAGCAFSSTEGHKGVNEVNIIWVGRNNNFSYPKFVYRDISLMVNNLPKDSKYFVIGITPALNESKEKLDAIKNINANLEKEYGDRFIDIWSILHERGLDMANRLPALADARSMGDGTIGATLYSDNVHFNSVTYSVIARIIDRKL